MGKWDFDADEGFFFFLAAIVAVIGLVRWYLLILCRCRSTHCGSIRASLAIVPIFSGAALWFVLNHWADPKYVLGQLDYQLLFLCGGIACLWCIRCALPIFGIDPRDDAIERCNPAAAIVVSGAMLGATAIYAGSNVGSGPTIWMTIIPALLATAAWLGIWMLVELISTLSESIAIDRDVATGTRHAAFLLAGGLMLGRTTAGDWTSWRETFASMLLLAWPVVPLAILAAIVGRISRPSKDQPEPSWLKNGLLPGTSFILLAVGYIVALGPPDIAKHIVTYEQYMKSK